MKEIYFKSEILKSLVDRNIISLSEYDEELYKIKDIIIQNPLDVENTNDDDLKTFRPKNINYR
ncbi:MAG: hypothetical protein N4A40_09925 [Tissierellales bacterium]|jgi:hypothetical protein|nr:hypothetical protein [Tissierellales bacterium]